MKTSFAYVHLSDWLCVNMLDAAKCFKNCIMQLAVVLGGLCTDSLEMNIKHF